jgi:hypothetical protein
MGSHIIINQFPKKELIQKPEQGAAGVAGGEGTDFGVDNQKLPEDLVNALKGLLKHFAIEVDKFPRRREVIDARLQRFYDRGYQYIYFDSSNYVFVPVTGGVSINVGGSSVNMPRYTNVYNIFKPYRRNFSAPLVQNPPGVNFKPANPSKSVDIKKAANAEKYAEHVKNVNPQKKLQAKATRLFWTDGRVVAFTEHVKNGQKYGKDEQGQDKGEEITTLHGVLEAKCIPITADEQDQLVCVILSDDPEINLMKEKYSDWPEADKIKPGPTGTGEGAFERNARIGVLQGTKTWAQSADAYTHLTTRHRVFLRPAGFKEAPDDCRDRLKQLFPDGCRFTIIGEGYFGSKNVSLDKTLKVSHALDGDGMNRPSWGKDMVTVQDAYNNYENMRQEYHDYGIPKTYFDYAYLSGEAMQEQISQPGNHIGGDNPTPGTPIENYFYTTQALTPPADLIEAEQDLRDAFAQFVSGVQPALFGANINKDDKVGVYSMARDQALGIMSLPWGSLQEMFAAIYQNSVFAAIAERHKNEKVTVSIGGKRGRKAKTEEIPISDLIDGDFNCVPDTDSSFPETTSQKKQAYQEAGVAAETNPLLMEAFLQPDTIELGKELWGVDIDIPASRAQEKALEAIDKLLQEEPVPDEQAFQAAMLAHAAQNAGVLTGEQAEETPLPDQTQFLKASVDVDPDLDFVKYMAQAVKNWWNSPEKDDAETQGLDGGLQNVRLFYLQLKKSAAMDQPMMPPMVPPARPVPGAPALPPAAAAGGVPAGQPVM